jgi:hypothetical protein
MHCIFAVPVTKEYTCAGMVRHNFLRLDDGWSRAARG